MKKIIYILCISFGFLTFTGCDKKNLECSKETVLDNGTIVSHNYKLSFIGNNIRTLSMNIDVSFGDIDDITRNSLENTISADFDDYKNRDGILYYQNAKENGFVININANYNKIDDRDKPYITIVNSGESYDGVKTELENSGFICK